MGGLAERPMFEIELNKKFPDILACGSELKNSFCIVKKNTAYISPVINDLKNWKEYKRYTENIISSLEKFNINPRIIAYDMHPLYLSSKFAQSFKSGEKIDVQHHHAHIAGCMIENNIYDEVIGIAFDGTGYGTDGNTWGSEFITCTFKNFHRKAHFKYIPVPGGDSAAVDHIRMGISYMYSALKNRNSVLDFFKSKSSKTEAILDMIDKSINTPLSSSCGRLFDAVGAILGLTNNIENSAETAVKLESLASENINDSYNYSIEKNDPIIINFDEMITNIINDYKNNISLNIISSKFHNTISEVVTQICSVIRKETGLEKVCLSGGVFFNKYLTGKIYNQLNSNGFTCFKQVKTSPGDSGLSLGQAVIAGSSV